MTLIDISRGVTSTLLLQALLTINKPGHNTKWAEGLGLKESFFPEKGYENFIQKLKMNPALIPEINIKEKNNTVIKNILQEYSLEPFNLFVYLSILIVFGYFETNNILLTEPNVGINSPSEALKILTGRQLSLSGSSPSLEKGTAFLLRDCFTVWEGEIRGKIRSVNEIRDPLDPTLIAKIIEIEKTSEKEIIGVLEANIDDTTPEVLAGAMRKILHEGALDYTLIPVGMKKNRQGVIVQVLCKEEDMDRLTKMLLTWTTTFGVRRFKGDRVKLDRKIENFQSSMGRIRIKKGFLENKLIRVTPEFDDMIKISDNTGISIQIIYDKIRSELERLI